MAEFPLEPQLSKILLASVDLNCSEEITTIVSMLSVQNVFYRPKEKEELADKKRAKFINYQGDHITLLNVYNEYIKHQDEEWCKENYLHYRNLAKAVEIKEILSF
jgi:ATP-dependent RNA helicase DHX8/PRP22